MTEIYYKFNICLFNQSMLNVFCFYFVPLRLRHFIHQLLLAICMHVSKESKWTLRLHLLAKAFGCFVAAQKCTLNEMDREPPNRI